MLALTDELPQLTENNTTTTFTDGNMHQLSEGDTSGIPKPVLPMDQEHNESPGDAFGGDTVKFSTEAPAQVAVVPGRVDITKLSVAPDTALLQNFLRRPVNIYTVEWTGASVSNHIDPWALFLNTISVQDKLTGYKYLRGTLHVDVQINGTPFHYGRLLMSYEPANNFRRSYDGDWRQHSNLPHVMLDPANNTVGKFDLPFISPELWVNLTSNFGAKLGVLNFDYVSELRVFEGGTPDPVTVQVYAWLEDLELAMPTQKAVAAFEAQAKKPKATKPNGGRSGDEYEANPNAGLISKPAAVLAEVAGRLTDVPLIGQFATATQIGAGAISKLAGLFGYSRPKDLTATDVFVARPTQNMVNCDVADQTVGMTVNSKSELSIDPRVIGMDNDMDELSVKSIASKWTLAKTYAWNNTDEPDTVLVRESICPTMLSDVIIAAEPRLHLTACGFAALPFRSWHGSIEVRVQIVCSNFHRGRLRFQWTPEESLSQSIQLGYNHVVDICDSKEFHLKLPYAGGEGFKEVESVADLSLTNFQQLKHSGRLKIIVQNKLVCPSVEPVQILVWVRGGDDLVFANPDFSVINETSVAVPIPPPLSGDIKAPPLRVHRTVEDLEQQSQAITGEWESEEIITFFDDSIHANYDLTYFGDPIRSFRPLLKRYQYTTTLGLDAAPATNQYNQYAAFIPMYPQMQGYNLNSSWTVQNGAAGVNVTKTHLANYLEVCFLAKRGGFRHIVDFTHTPLSGDTRVSNLTAHRVTDKNFRGVFSMSTNSIGDTVARGPRLAAVGLGMRGGVSRQRFLDDTMPGGGQIFTAQQNGQRIAVEMPFYNNFRYVTHFGDHEVETDPQKEAFDTVDQSLVVSYSLSPDEAEAADIYPGLKIYSAALEDFTMHFWLGVPELYLSALPSAPTDYSTGWRQNPFPQY